MRLGSEVLVPPPMKIKPSFSTELRTGEFAESLKRELSRVLV